MGQTPDQLKAGIAGTRADMSATLDAIADHTSPRRIASRQAGRARSRLGVMRDSVMGTASNVSSSATGTVSGVIGAAGDAATGTADGLRAAPGRAQDQARGNPLAAGLVAFGAGLVLASVLPATEAEKRAAATLSEEAQPVVEHAQAAGHELAGQLQSSAQDAAQEVKQAATAAASEIRDQASQAGQEVAGATRDAASEVKNQATERERPAPGEVQPTIRRGQFDE